MVLIPLVDSLLHCSQSPCDLVCTTQIMLGR